MEVDRTAIRALFEAPTATRPRWAPTGRRLVYTVAVPDAEANRTTSELWLLEADGATSERLVEGIPTGDPPASWSSDGTRLAYAETDDETDRIVVIGLDGSRREIDLAQAPHGRLATLPFFRTFAWSPTDDRLLYSAYNPDPEDPPDPAVNPRNDGDGLGEVERIRLWVHDLRGNEPPRPVTSDDYHSGAGIWLPNGQDVVFVSNRSGHEEGAVASLTQPFAIWKTDTDGSTERPLVSDSHAAVVPAVQADGRRLAYQAAPMTGPHAVNMELTTVDTSGSDRRTLTGGLDRSVDPESPPAATPDGSWIVVLMDGMRSVLLRASETAAPESLALEQPHASLPDVDGCSGEIACVTQAATTPPEIDLLSPEGRSRWRSAHHGIESKARSRIWTFEPRRQLLD